MSSSHRLPLALALLVLPACGDKEGDSAEGDCTPAGTAVGSVTAQVDGAPWTAGGVQATESGDGIQLTSAVGGGWRLTLVAQTTEDGTGVLDALELGAATVTLESGEGGFAVLYPDSGAGSYSTNDGGGVAVLVREGDRIDACFSFTAGGAEGDISVTGGQLSAPQ
jgi:hypothetical protein